MRKMFFFLLIIISNLLWLPSSGFAQYKNVQSSLTEVFSWKSHNFEKVISKESSTEKSYNFVRKRFLPSVEMTDMLLSNCDKHSADWFPSELNIQPFTANFLEPKAGFSYMLGESKIRLDIGTSSDIYHKYIGNAKLSFGADLFTYTRLRGEKEFHFPVETIDYFFGINSGYKITKGKNEYGFRLRISHISAHLVDGRWSNNQENWRDGRRPKVYSREFLELFPFYRINRFRIYGGLTYLFHTSPGDFGKFIYQAGFDFFYDKITRHDLSLFIAYDFKLSEVMDKNFGNNIISAGIKFGKYNEKGFSILLSYFSGKSIHGEFFELSENYTTLGFNLDL